MCIESHVKHYFGRHFINANTVGSRAGRSYRLQTLIRHWRESASIKLHVCFSRCKMNSLPGKAMLSHCSVVSCCLLPLPCYRWILNRHSHSSGVSVVNRSGRGFPATSWYTHYTSKNSRENSCVNPLLFIFQRIENLKSNRRRKVHLCGKWKDFFMISHRCSLSHREYLTAVLSVKVRFLNYRAKKIKVITNLLLLLLLV